MHGLRSLPNREPSRNREPCVRVFLGNFPVGIAWGWAWKLSSCAELKIPAGECLSAVIQDITAGLRCPFSLLQPRTASAEVIPFNGNTTSGSSPLKFDKLDTQTRGDLRRQRRLILRHGCYFLINGAKTRFRNRSKGT